MTPSDVYYWTTILVCIGICQSSMADLIIALRHKPLMNFRLWPQAIVSRHMRAFSPLYNGKAAWALKAISLLSAITSIGIVLAGQNPKLPLLVVFITQLLSYPRWRYFVSSDSPLLRAIFVALMLHYFVPDNGLITEAGLFFLATYLVLIYSITGLQKLKSQLWRSGQAIQNFMNRYPFWRMISPDSQKPKWLIKVGSWFVILFECLFFIGLLWPEAAPVFLIVGLLFHGILSITVGINHFFWTFISVYPAYLYISTKAPETVSLFTHVFAGL
ncbi:hypothetical protein [Roseivirga sp. E12]|uniref:hypothetical protein n=1 Tax=Roseivirga sp. E12 TaxID=2819237 RepID=UPI001ABCCC3C|nr:hypothetical protein [Roseivirga sp. E12]MBO3699050.1 hypothetical protein [Roseivirga sp. E12]